MEAGLSESYDFGSGTTQDNLAASSSTAFSAKGFSEPTLHFNYRYWGGLSGTRFGSVYVDLVPALGRHKTAGPFQQGNYLAANSDVEVGTNVYFVYASSEFGVEPSIRYNSSGRSNAAGPANTNDTDADYTYTVSGHYRIHALPELYFGAGLALDGEYTLRSRYPDRAKVTTSRTGYPFTVTPTLDVGWLPTEYLRFGAIYTYQDFTTKQHVETAALASDVSTHYVQDSLTVQGAWIF